MSGKRIPKLITKEQLAPLVAQGMSSIQIAPLLGVKDCWIRTLIKKFDIQRPSFADRFWMRVAKGAEPDSCWLWTQSTDTSGYGLCAASKIGLKAHEKAHRVSFFLTNGHLPLSPLILLHSCDNPRCVNPSHLSAGTHKANARDKIQKGRQAPPLRGESNACHILTAEGVRFLRSAVASGTPLTHATRKIGVPYHAAWNAVNGRTWRHLDASE